MTAPITLLSEGRIAHIKIEERPLAQVTRALHELKAGKVQGILVLTGNSSIGRSVTIKIQPAETDR